VIGLAVRLVGAIVADALNIIGHALEDAAVYLEGDE
jgi:hypothetical protein